MGAFYYTTRMPAPMLASPFMAAFMSSPQAVVSFTRIGSHRTAPLPSRIRAKSKTQPAVRFTAQLQIKPAAIEPRRADKGTEKWDGMVLFFVSETVAIEGRNSLQLRIHIENLLKAKGDPVRWAITKVDKMEGTCEVDAVLSRCGNPAS